MKTAGRIFMYVCFAAALVLFCLPLAGCAVGFSDSGEVVSGIAIGSAPENAGQFLRGAADFLPPPWNYVAGGAIALFGLGGTSVASRAAAKRSEERARQMADHAWDEATARAHAERDRADANWVEGAMARVSVSPPSAGGAGDRVG